MTFINEISDITLNWIKVVQPYIDINILVIFIIIFLFFLMYFIETKTSAKILDFKEKFTDLFESSGISFGIIDQMVIIDCNSSALTMFRYLNKDEFLQLKLVDLSPETQKDGSNSLEKMKEMINVAQINSFNRFEWIFRKKSGAEFLGEIMFSKFFIASKNLLLFSIFDMSEQVKRDKENLYAMERVQRQQSAIIKISSSVIRQDISFEKAFQLINEIASEVLRVERTSFWKIKLSTRQMECLDLYERSKKLHSSGELLNLEDYQIFFNSLSQERTIVANDVVYDKRTRELLENHLKPFEIKSILDAFIRTSGNIVGIVCFEHVITKRNWTEDEIRFAGELSDQFSQLCIKWDHIRFEEALQKSETRYKTLIDSAVDAIFIHDYQGNFVECNQAICDLLGYSCLDLLSMSIFDIDRDAKNHEGLYTLWKHLPITYETFYKHKDHVILPVEVRLGSIELSGKKVIQGVVRNIYERKKSEDLLKHQAILLENINEAVITMDSELNITSWNKLAESIYGWTREEVIGKKASAIFQTNFQAITSKKVQECLNESGKWIGEVIQKMKNGSTVHIHASTSVIRDRDNKIIEYITVNRDITERINIEKMKDEFVSMVSHELRTPLTAIKESINLAMNGTTGKITDLQKDLLDTGKRNLDRLIRLINDVLNLQKLQINKYEIRKDFNQINMVIEEVVNMMLPLAQIKKIDLTYHLDKDIPLFPFDKDKIAQVLTNLVHNAIKFTKLGQISIVSKIISDKQIEVSVNDTGIGIRKEDREKIFESFMQVAPLEYRVAGSTGLGLAISKEIISKHGGFIRVITNENNGSSFIFSLPV
jgi:PAS domain S-box-containing protein